MHIGEHYLTFIDNVFLSARAQIEPAAGSITVFTVCVLDDSDAVAASLKGWRARRSSHAPDFDGKRGIRGRLQLAFLP